MKSEKRRFIIFSGVVAVLLVLFVFNSRSPRDSVSEFAVLDDDNPKARLFVSVEDWLNDGVDMPRDLARTCILDWYNDNRPGLKQWEVGGRLMDLSMLTVPALVMASTNDRLVPRESSLAMAGLLPDAKVMEPSAGHIGMMTGRNAERQVWAPIAKWICEAG